MVSNQRTKLNIYKSLLNKFYPYVFLVKRSLNCRTSWHHLAQATKLISRRYRCMTKRNGNHQTLNFMKNHISIKILFGFCHKTHSVSRDSTKDWPAKTAYLTYFLLASPNNDQYREGIHQGVGSNYKEAKLALVLIKVQVYLLPN